MIKRTYRGFIQLIGGLGAGLAIVLVLLSWKLSSGPISLSFLTPYIEKGLDSSQSSFKFRLDDTILTWAGWRRALDIRVINVRIVGTEGSVLAHVPELSLSLSARALLRGMVAPKRIELFRPSLRLVRHRDGTVEVGFGDGAKTSTLFFKGMLAELLATPDPRRAMGYLSRVNIIDGDLTLIDQARKVSWKAPLTQLEIVRETDGIKGTVSFDLEIEDQKTHVTVLGEYKAAGRRLDLGIDFDRISPTVFSGLSDQMGILAAFNLPVQGTATVSMTIDGDIESLGFDLSGGSGRISMGKVLPHDIEVKKMTFQGRYEGETKVLEIENLSLDLGANGHIELPQSANHRMPVKSIRIKGRFKAADDRLEVDVLEADLGGPSARLSAVINGVGNKMAVGVRGEFFNFPFDQFEKYWPAAWGNDAHQWTIANLSDGLIRTATANVGLRSDGSGGFDLISLSGDMDLEDVTVNYLTPMPKITGVSGTATFDRKTFEIAVSRGKSEGLNISQGSIIFTGLDEVDQYIDIDLQIDGSVTDTLNLIDHEPLVFVSALGIDPADTSGRSNTRLKLNFIVENALTRDQVKVSAVSTVENVVVRNAVLGLDITAGILELKIDNQGMDVNGSVKFGTIPASLSWRENFGLSPSYKSRYLIHGSVGDTQRTSELGLGFPPFWGDVVKGALGANIRYTVFNDQTGNLEVSLDLSEAALTLPVLGWSKDPGEPGAANFDLRLIEKKIKEISRFSVTAGDLKIDGSARYAIEGSGDLERIDLDHFIFGRTDLKGALIPAGDNSWTVSVHGESFDLEPLWDDLFDSVDHEGDGKKNGEDQSEKPRFSLSVDIGRVWLGEDRQARSVSGTLVSDGETWKRIRLTGETGDNKSFEIKIEPAKEGKRALSITAQDAGSVLRTFDIYDDMIGGKLTITGKFDDSVPESPLRGQILIKNYRIVEAPVLVRLVSILALTGILDSLQGDGLGFAILDAPFTLESGVLEVKDARASGLSLGFTASGKIYTHAEILEMKGTVVPAYMINSALGHIPILGPLFTGGEKGGGVFASTYTMTGPLEDPDIEINHLSVLAPGFLRQVFGVFDKDRESTQESNKVPTIREPDTIN